MLLSHVLRHFEMSMVKDDSVVSNRLIICQCFELLNRATINGMNALNACPMQFQKAVLLAIAICVLI